MSQPTFLTTGNDVLDRELADLRKLMDQSARRINQIESGVPIVQQITQSATTTVPTGNITFSGNLSQTSTSALVGFFGKTPTARSTAYTLTYATATRTQANPTATSVATTASTQTTPWGYGSQAQADALPVAINALIVDVANVKQVLNEVIIDLQAIGLLQ